MDCSVSDNLYNETLCPEKEKKSNSPLLSGGPKGKVLRKGPSSPFQCALPGNPAILRTEGDKLQWSKTPREKGQLKQ